MSNPATNPDSLPSDAVTAEIAAVSGQRENVQPGGRLLPALTAD